MIHLIGARLRGSVAFFVAFFATPFVQAGGLLVPFEFESASVLPQRVFNPRLKSFFTGGDQKYDNQGQRQPLASPLIKNVTFSDIVSARSTQAEKAQIQSVLSDPAGSGAIASNASAGTINGDVKTAVSVFLPSFGYGVTPRWTLGICVPVVRTDVSVATGFTRSQDGQNFLGKVALTSPVDAQKAERDINNALQDQLSSNGYEPLASGAKTQLGDVRLVSKYQLYGDEHHRWVIKNTLTAPTGSAPNPNQLVDTASGDGQWDLGGTLVYDSRRILGGFGLMGYGGYTVQFPDRIEMRVPEPGKMLTSDKEVVDRDLGDVVSSGAAVQYEIGKSGVSLATGYNFQFQAASSYSGSKYSANRYQVLGEKSPAQVLHSWTVAASFSSVDFYRAGRFQAPFEATVTYSQPIAARNVVADDVIGTELVFFF